MAKKFIVRLIRAVTLLIGLSILTFSLIHLSPMDPINAYVGGDSSVSIEQIERIKEYWGVAKSPMEQYFTWIGAILKGNFGISKLYRRPVIDIIRSRFITSFALMGTAWILSAIFGYLLGVISAMNRGKIIDKIIKWYSYTLVSTPIFWLGLLLLIVFAVELKWFPVGLAVPAGVLESNIRFIDRVRHFVLPALTLSILGVANIAMHTREKMIDILNTEYITFAKARGESKWQIFKNHGFRNSVIPAISLQFAYFGELFGGSVLAEQVFAYPGLGSILTTAGLKGDLPLLMGIILISSLFVFVGNFIADILNTVVDPRIKEDTLDV
ncbi:ABC transporter permease [Clostridium tetani]|uniref:ABC transporter permease n=1 Tax=Clostridium tetani TaxID=1513 RepID=A0ABY0ESG4_CLOTA|nr:ABC transporter permease [Clostridium tetani]CDI50053.1 dipeptide transport system permease proteindppB [Clostridium tetani 12124569]KHO38556.1 ABC transporter permease [Clostridium tetani]RXI40111.1 ABC transporter permease [Clostridium tetani]RXI54936.1 ABC transporter permease [Clostridium tetani]RXI71743.1 ABC transporter permease [Clostridium tetani]